MNTTTQTRPVSTTTRPTCTVTRPRSQRLPRSFYEAIEVAIPEEVLAEGYAISENDEPDLLAEEMAEAMNPFQVTVSNRIASGPVNRLCVKGAGRALYSVPSDDRKSNRVYTVETAEHRPNRCTCPDWRRNSQYHAHICKHMRAVEIHVGAHIANIRSEIEGEVFTAIADHSILETLCERYGLAVYETELYLAIQQRVHKKRDSLFRGMRYLCDPIPAK